MPKNTPILAIAHKPNFAASGHKPPKWKEMLYLLPRDLLLATAITGQGKLGADLVVYLKEKQEH